jgi:hypothetical protein
MSAWQSRRKRSATPNNTKTWLTLLDTARQGVCGSATDQEVGMAHWKRLTGTDGDQIDVNMDAVAYLQELKNHTAIHFVGGLSAEGKAIIVGVREKPDTIHSANPLHAA